MTHSNQLPATATACRERLVVLADEIAATRTQIATADLRRQAERRAFDAYRFHQAKTALRLKQQEAAQLRNHLKTLDARGRRDAFKDALIEVVRVNYDDVQWAQVLRYARALQRAQEDRDG